MAARGLVNGRGPRLVVGGIQFFNTIPMALIQYFYEIYLRVQDRPFEIVREEQIAAAADMQNRTRQFLKFDIDKISHRIIFHETAGLHLHSEGVHLRKILIVFCLDHSVFRSPVKPGMTGDYPISAPLQRVSAGVTKRILPSF